MKEGRKRGSLDSTDPTEGSSSHPTVDFAGVGCVSEICTIDCTSTNEYPISMEVKLRE